jgi:hypothetical protein
MLRHFTAVMEPLPAREESLAESPRSAALA